MGEPPRDLRERTKMFALRIIRLYGRLPQRIEAQVIGKQLLRSGTSVGANYREAQRARSDAEFLAKPGICLQELDESTYWLELLAESGLVKPDLLDHLRQENDQLLAIFTTIVKKRKAQQRRG